MSTRPKTVIGEASGSQALDEQNPWPGLASYDEASRAFFRGREADAAELLRLIKLSPFVVFYGKSGLGKSSVLQAGVFQPLRDAHFLPVHLRLDYAEKAEKAQQVPLMEQAAMRLREAIAAAGADAPEREPGESLWAYLQRRDTPIWGADNFPLTPVLVFDQFEEVFSRGGSREHLERQLTAMADFVASRLPHDLASDAEAVRRLDLRMQRYHVVLSFRSDFLADVEGWVKRTNLPRHESLQLTAMSRKSAVRALEAGAAVLEPGMAEQIVDFLLQREVKGDGAAPAVVSPLSGDVEPALLSLCCYQLNRKRKEKGLAKIDVELLRTFGASILADFYREAIKDMPPRVPRFIEDNLILGERYRNPFPRDEAIRSGGLTKDELDQLTKNRLLRLDPQGDDLRVELIHDRLVGVVRAARDARRAREAQEVERAAAEKQQRDALEKLQRENEAAEQRVQLERERERSVQTERRRRRLMGAAAVMAVMIVGLVVQSYRARVANERLDAKSRDLTAANAELTESVRSANETAAARLEAAQEDADEWRLQLEESKNRVAELELALAREQAKNTGAAAGAARVSQAQALEREQAQKLMDYKASRDAPRRQPDYTVRGWRLASNGCGRGVVSVSGTAEFKVVIAGGTVEVSEAFDGSGDDFKVTINARETFAAKNPGCYELPTTGHWNGPAGRSFKTQGIDRVCVNEEGAPVSATISRIRTDCGP